MHASRLAAGCITAVVIGQLAFLKAQSSSASADELVKELRLIRISLESSNQANGRRELLIERYKLEHDLVISMTDRLEAVRDESSMINDELTKASAQLAEVQVSNDAVVVANTDADRKAQLESQLYDAQARLQELKTHQARLSRQEDHLSAILASEQPKLNALEKELDDLVK